jgi:lambda family phage portal protein
MFGSAKRDLFDVLYRSAPEPRKAAAPRSNIVAVSDLPQARWMPWTGDKFAGGFGPTDVLWPDYWTLRARSAQLFKQNLYARGIIRRLITNEINVGLHLEATPEEKILGFEEDGLADWTEDVENRFKLWEQSPRLCDHTERLTFGALQAQARREALVTGDVLVVLQQDQRTRLPRIRLISGAAIQTPLVKPQGGNKIVHGVEIDPMGRHVAFWVRQTENTLSSVIAPAKRLPAYGEKSGRKLAWLLYGTDKRLDEVRGEPLLSLVLQSIKEIDRYRDSVQRKAVINSMLAMFIEKTEDKPGTKPIAGAGISRRLETVIDSIGTPRTFNTTEYIPGVVIDELQTGEKPVAFPSHGTDEKFGEFEKAVIQAIAWAHGIPPEILILSFNNNYSASQAAINEFKMLLNETRTEFGAQFCQPVYNDWLLAEVLSGRIEARGLLEAWRDPLQYDTFGAWISADWSGHIKPAVDLSKLVVGYEKMIDQGLITRARAARELTGTRYSKNVQQLARENAALAEANAPIAELENPKPEPAPAEGGPPGSEDESEENDDAEALRLVSSA